MFEDISYCCFLSIICFLCMEQINPKDDSLLSAFCLILSLNLRSAWISDLSQVLMDRPPWRWGWLPPLYRPFLYLFLRNHQGCHRLLGRCLRPPPKWKPMQNQVNQTNQKKAKQLRFFKREEIIIVIVFPLFIDLNSFSEYSLWIGTYLHLQWLFLQSNQKQEQRKTKLRTRIKVACFCFFCFNLDVERFWSDWIFFFGCERFSLAIPTLSLFPTPYGLPPSLSLDGKSILGKANRKQSQFGNTCQH